MANKKFSDFTSKTSPSDVSFVVGYDGSDNVRISIANMNSAYLPLAGGTMTGNLILDDNSGSSPQIQFINGSNDTGEILLNSSGKLEISTGGTDRLVISSGDTEFTGDITLADNKKAIFGAGSDLEIYHDSSNSYIEQSTSATGDLIIQQKVDDKDIIFKSDDGSGGVTPYLTLDGSATTTVFSKNTRHDDLVLLQVGSSNDAAFYHNATDTFLTNETGHLYIRNTSDDKDIIFQTDDGSGGLDTYFQILGQYNRMQFNKNVRSIDNAKITFGSDDDLQIYHDGSNSYIDETGTGSLYARASDSIFIQKSDGTSNMAQFTAGAGSHLYHNNSLKFSTISTGVSVTGQVNISALNTAPSSASDTGTLGEIRFTADYIFVCVATDTWKRVAIATW